MNPSESDQSGLLLDDRQEEYPNPTPVAATPPDAAVPAGAGSQTATDQAMRLVNLVLAILLLACIIGVAIQYQKNRHEVRPQKISSTLEQAAPTNTVIIDGVRVYAPERRRGLWGKPKPQASPRAVKPVPPARPG